MRCPNCGETMVKQDTAFTFGDSLPTRYTCECSAVVTVHDNTDAVSSGGVTVYTAPHETKKGSDA